MWDVAVVGAGPAGASAAWAAARLGVRVLLLERKPHPGHPVRCAEYIPALLLGELPIERAFVVQSVRGMATHLSGREVRKSAAPGFLIDRRRFDEALVAEAVRAGAILRCGTRVLGLQGSRLLLKGPSGAREGIEARVVIGADGPHSRVARALGHGPGDLIPALQVILRLERPLEETQVHFEPLYRGGYAWVFPKGDTANVGVAMRVQEGPGLREALDRFVTGLERRGVVVGPPRGRVFGWIPVGRPRNPVTGPVLLAGDAASHTHAITGAGVPQAVMGGHLAGDWAGRAAAAGDLSLLENYGVAWEDLFGDTLERACRRREELETGWDRLADLLPRCWPAFREYHGTP